MPPSPRILVRYHAPWLLPFCLRELPPLLARMQDTANRLRLGTPINDIELSLVSDGQIAAINERALGCKGPTNILSFPGGSDFCGSLVLSLDTYDRECLLYGQDRTMYCIHLLAHGIAHLTELDHGLLHDQIHDACVASAAKSVGR